MSIKPIIFIDTSIFESENFFKGRNLLSLCNLSKDNVVELKITDIIYEELKQRIKSNILKAQTSIKKSLQALNGEGKILKNVDEFTEVYSKLSLDFPKIELKLLNQLDKFLKKYNIEIINSNISDVNEVFKDYFAVKPPFKDGVKKNEFPDAFSINTIKKWSEKNNKKVIFLTIDSDFIELSFKNIDNSHTISTLLDFITRHTNETHSEFIENQITDPYFGWEITDLLTQDYDSQLRQAIEEDIFFYTEYFEPEIEQLENYYPIIDSKKINSIVQNQNVIFEIDASISFDCKLSYYDISNAYYDKEDDEWYGKELKNVTKTFVANIICLADFEYNLDDDFFEFKELTNFEVVKIEEV